MSDTTTEERKPPTLADIVREKTDDGRRIIDFFLDVMEDRIDGAELCHRIDAAKQLEKHKSRAAARFLAKHRGVSCGHSTGGRPNPADPCSATERSLVAVTLNAPANLTREFLTVLSRIDEFLMARLIRAQTADGGTIIDFLDDVMQDRNDGFKCHHRIAAAKELIVHIVRDEQPESVPAEAPVSVSAKAPSSVRAEPGQIVVPAESLPRTRYGREPIPLTLRPTQPQLPGSLPPRRRGVPRRACPVLDTGREPIPGPAKPVASLPKNPRTKHDGPEHDAPEHSDAGTEPPGPPLSESTQAPSVTRRKSRTSPPEWNSPPPSVESRRSSNSTGTSRTPGPDQSTPQPQAAHPPGDRDPTTQLRESTPWPHIYGGITVTWYNMASSITRRTRPVPYGTRKEDPG